MQHSSTEGQFPDYRNPPVVETILGVQFERLPPFKNAHLGAFWKTLDTDEWPSVSDAPVLEPQSEQFTESARWAKIVAQLSLTQVPSSRLQIKNRNGDRMIQVQNGRLHFNWLGEGGGEYVRYERVREGFLGAWQRFVEFVAHHELGEIRANQWEVTYLNHIEKGTVWETPSDWGFFRLLAAVPTVEGVIEGESFTGAWHFVIPPRRGRLHVQWQHGRRSEPEKREVIVLTLTARGPIAETDNQATEAIAHGLDLGRATIVRSFKELMTDSANQYWGLKHASD